MGSLQSPLQSCRPLSVLYFTNFSDSLWKLLCLTNQLLLYDWSLEIINMECVTDNDILYSVEWLHSAAHCCQEESDGHRNDSS